VKSKEVDLSFPKLTMTVGAILSVLGVGAYILAEDKSFTALIPTFLGVILLVLGYVGQDEKRRAAMMHVAVVVALLGILGSFRLVIALVDIVSGDGLENPVAFWAQLILVIVLGVYLFLAIRSFIEARRNREAKTA
jgi:hypothetical protein